MGEKVFISADELLRDSMQLGIDILKSGFRPTYIVGVWRGGAPVGITVQEVLEHTGVETNHIAIRTASYGKGTSPSPVVKVFGMNHLVETINAEDRLLIVDDVFDSGGSVQAIIEDLHARCRKNAPHDVKVATVYFKPKKNKTNRIPDFFVHETEEWLVFPHELHGLSDEEIRANKPLPPEAFKL